MHLAITIPNSSTSPAGVPQGHCVPENPAPCLGLQKSALREKSQTAGRHQKELGTKPEQGGPWSSATPVTPLAIPHSSRTAAGPGTASNGCLEGRQGRRDPGSGQRDSLSGLLHEPGRPRWLVSVTCQVRGQQHQPQARRQRRHPPSSASVGRVLRARDAGRAQAGPARLWVREGRDGRTRRGGRTWEGGGRERQARVGRGSLGRTGEGSRGCGWASPQLPPPRPRGGWE